MCWIRLEAAKTRPSSWAMVVSSFTGPRTTVESMTVTGYIAIEMFPRETSTAAVAMTAAVNSPEMTWFIIISVPLIVPYEYCESYSFCMRARTLSRNRPSLRSVMISRMATTPSTMISTTTPTTPTMMTSASMPLRMSMTTTAIAMTTAMTATMTRMTTSG